MPRTSKRPCEGRGPGPDWSFSGSPAIYLLMKSGYVYIVASGRNGTVYIGSTSDLVKRAWEHRSGAVAGFTRKHGCKMLVWYEAYGDIELAIQREKQMKEWNRLWKLRVIEETNPEWKDLYESLI